MIVLALKELTVYSDECLKRLNRVPWVTCLLNSPKCRVGLASVALQITPLFHLEFSSLTSSELEVPVNWLLYLSQEAVPSQVHVQTSAHFLFVQKVNTTRQVKKNTVFCT